MAKLMFGTFLGAAGGWIVGYLMVTDRLNDTARALWAAGLMPFRTLALAPDVVFLTGVGAVIGLGIAALVGRRRRPSDDPW